MPVHHIVGPLISDWWAKKQQQAALKGPAGAAKWSGAQLSGALDHLQHGHTGATEGHGWLTPKMAAAARGNCGPGFFRNASGTCSPYGSSEPVRAFGSGLVPGGGTCPEGTWDIAGICVNKPGGVVTGGGAVLSGGEAVMGRYGAAMVPGSKMIDRAVCLPGMVVANDGLCYNKSQIKNADREWPRGRRPLLTGGEMRAISVAHRAASKLEKTQKRLMAMGMLKKPASRRAPGRSSAPRVTSVSDDSILRIGKG